MSAQPLPQRKPAGTQVFLDQLSKVQYKQILTSPRKPVNTKGKLLKRLTTLSPFFKGEAGSPEKTARSGKEDGAKRKLGKRNKCELELGLRRLTDMTYSRLRSGLGQLRRAWTATLRRSAEVPSTRFDSQGSSYNSFLSLTECPQCHHVGISLLTTSTKDQFSPKFLQKVRSLLPGPSEISAKSFPQPKDQKSKHEVALSMDQYEEAELQDIPDISDIRMDPFSVSSEETSELASDERGVVSLRSPDIKTGMKLDRSFDNPPLCEVNLTDIPSSHRWGYKVPRLNFTYIHSPVKALSRRRKDSSLLTGAHPTGRIESGLDKIRRIVLTRVQRAFYITLLSRSRGKGIDAEVIVSPRTAGELSPASGDVKQAEFRPRIHRNRTEKLM